MAQSRGRQMRVDVRHARASADQSADSAAMPRHGRASAISCLTEAIEVARVQSALALELRSMMTLARLLSKADKGISTS